MTNPESEKFFIRVNATLSNSLERLKRPGVEDKESTENILISKTLQMI